MGVPPNARLRYSLKSPRRWRAAVVSAVAVLASIAFTPVGQVAWAGTSAKTVTANLTSGCVKSYKAGVNYFPDRATVTKGLERLEQEGSKFNYVFLDPPYNEIAEYHHVLRLLARSHLLDSRSLVIVEHSRHCLLEEAYGSLHRQRLIRHGDAQLGFYRLE